MGEGRAPVTQGLRRGIGGGAIRAVGSTGWGYTDGLLGEGASEVGALGVVVG